MTYFIKAQVGTFSTCTTNTWMTESPQSSQLERQETTFNGQQSKLIDLSGNTVWPQA